MSGRYRLPGAADSVAGVVFRIWKQRFFGVWGQLYDRGLLPDWRQEAYTIALEAVAAGLSYGHPELPGFIYRKWYRFLVNLGFRKNGKFSHPELQLSETEREPRRHKRSSQEEEPAPLYWTFNGRTYVFTSHFLKRWKERAGVEFSPWLVLQQMGVGKRVRSRDHRGMVAILCPWFYLAVKETPGQTIFVTVWTRD